MFQQFTPIPTDPDPDMSAEDAETLANHTTLLMATALESGVGPGEALGLPQDYFDAMQELATRYYGSQRYEDAFLLFQRLFQLKPGEMAYFKGMGACQLGLEEYEKAEGFYSMAYMTDPSDVEINYYLGLAQYHQKKFDVAFDSLRYARVLAEQSPETSGQLAQWATLLLERMKPLVDADQAALIDKRG